MNLQNISLPEQPTTIHLTQIYVMLLMRLNQRFRLPDAAQEISRAQNCEYVTVYANVQPALLAMACVGHNGNRLQKIFDPDQPPTREMTPDTCRTCHFSRNRTEGCMILQAHQKKLSRERI